MAKIQQHTNKSRFLLSSRLSYPSNLGDLDDLLQNPPQDNIMKNETSQLLVSGGNEGGPQNENERLPSLFTLVRDGAVLTNTGSTARDQLANERTYLAWMRTALSLIGAGLALLKWDAVANAAGYLVAALGIVLLVTSTQRYFRVMRLLQQGKFEPNVGGIISIVAVTVAAIVAAFYLQHTHQL